MSKLERIVYMHDVLTHGPFPTREEICFKYSIAERTFFDDLQYMRDRLSLDIKLNPSTGRYYNANPKRRLPEFDLTEGEVFALTLGKEMLSQYVGTSFEPVLRAAIEKIMKRLPDRVRIDADDVTCMVKFDPGAVIPVERKMFLDLNKACEKSHPVEIRYFTASTGETKNRVIEPLKLLENRATWYVVAYCRLRKERRLFALHRIEHYDVLDVIFVRHDEDSIDEWIEKAFQLEHSGKEHRVKIHFQERAARYIRERHWHDSQVLTDLDDKSCTLEFVTQSLDETKRWVMTYGAEAVVMEPAELRTMVRDEHAKALNGYAGDETQVA